jgi:hypothetical protein
LDDEVSSEFRFLFSDTCPLNKEPCETNLLPNGQPDDTRMVFLKRRDKLSIAK